MIIGIDAHNLEGNRTGVGRYLFNLLKIWALPSSGSHSDTSMYQSDPSARFTFYFKDKIPSDLPPSGLFESKLLNVGSTAKFIHWDLPRAAKKDKVDILFCPGYVAPLFYQGKIALTLHDIIYEARPDLFNWPSPADKILLKWVSKMSARRARIIFVPSEFTKHEVVKFYRVPSGKIILASLAADLAGEEAAGIDKTEAAKKKYRIVNKFVFYVGSIFSRRHLPEIISAFSKLAAQRPDFQLLLAGKDFTKEKNIGDLIVRHNDALGREVIVRIDFIGDSDLKLLYSACAFFVWLSDYEGFGLPPLEAMINDAPVITSDTTSLKEVAGQAALLIKNNSESEEIKEAMEQLMENESLRQELMVRGKEQAGKFSWQECARLTLDALLNS